MILTSNRECRSDLRAIRSCASLVGPPRRAEVPFPPLRPAPLVTLRPRLIRLGRTSLTLRLHHAADARHDIHELRHVERLADHGADAASVDGVDLRRTGGGHDDDLDVEDRKSTRLNSS